MFPPLRKTGWVPWLLLGEALLSQAACRSAGRFFQEMLRERPPAPLDSMSVASDARVDSQGYIVGSFVGEGTSRAVHLYLGLGGDLWGALARQQIIPLTAASGRRRTRGGLPVVDRALVGGPAGHTSVIPTAIMAHGSSCGWRGAQLEIIVEDEHRAQYPSLRGPVLGSFSRSQSSAPADIREFRLRERLPDPDARLKDDLIARTSRVMDSLLNHRFRALNLGPAEAAPLEINTLADVDAAEVISYRPRAAAVRFAVSLRERRIAAGGDTLLASTVMSWDSAGTWQQVIFRPTLISLRRGRLAPTGALGRSLFWRRLQPISDFGFERDNLWMEQVDVADGRVLWGVIQPRGNVVVAAAELEGPCR